MIKLTGGYLKGQYIRSIPGLSTRPSNSKVRQAIFNIVQDRIYETRWLDLFGGTGSVGFEAISRGASEAVFIEKDYTAFSCLKNNIETLKLSDRVTVLKKEALAFLNTETSGFDFIYVDPPYQSDQYQKVLSVLENKPSILKENGQLIIEHATRNSLPEIKFLKVKSYKYGDTSLTFYSKN